MQSNPLQPPLVRMPRLADGHWFNTAVPLQNETVRGHVVLVDFWDYTCINCIRTLPYLTKWHERYRDMGFTLIGIHTPEFKFAQTKLHVERAISSFGLNYPILLDNGQENWSRFAVKAWPTKFLIDSRGYIRLQTQGEGRYGLMEQAIQQLLRQQHPDVALPDLLPALRDEDKPGSVCIRPTPEIYAGYQGGGLFGGGLGNLSGYMPEQTIFYKMPKADEMENGRFYLSGAWRAHPESVAFAGQQGGKMHIPYSAATINAVIAPSADAVTLALDLKPTEQPPIIWVKQDGQWLDEHNAGKDVQFDEDGRSYITVTQPAMVELVNNHTFAPHLLQLTFQAHGLALFAFSFSSCLSPIGTDDETFTVQ